MAHFGQLYDILKEDGISAVLKYDKQVTAERHPSLTKFSQGVKHHAKKINAGLERALEESKAAFPMDGIFEDNSQNVGLYFAQTPCRIVQSNFQVFGTYVNAIALAPVRVVQEYLK
ncbi:hypothetical protein HOC35_03475 [Candidatus Woesearchaeota archaeon]|jgi:hypothetical protein|nr:hypothetical protein [Candidatus Woesearchaeota archaeon]